MIRIVHSIRGGVLAGLLATLLGLASLPASALAPIAQWQQPSGAQVWFMASPAIPIVDVQVDFDAGSLRDPAGQAGLAAATALMLDKGVAASDAGPALDENELGEAWADLAASFGAGAGGERMSFNLRSLAEEDLLQQAVALAARQLGQPSWPEAVWQREREQWKAALAESLTRPGTLAQRAFKQAVYGDHPGAALITPESLDAIGVADMQAKYQQQLQACHARVSIVGALSRERADALASELLAQLPGAEACSALPDLPPVPPLKQAQREDIAFDSAQAHVLIGQPGYARSDPDYFPLLVGNHILGGGGFTSRLMSEVREKRGLSYGVYSGFSPGRVAGPFTVSLQTRSDQAAEAMAITQQVIADFVAQGPTEDELQAAKDNLVGSLPLRLDSNRKLLGNLANIAWNGLPLDYLDTWTQKVEAVSRSDITAAFQRTLQPDRMVTVHVGPQQAAD